MVLGRARDWPGPAFATPLLASCLGFVESTGLLKISNLMNGLFDCRQVAIDVLVHSLLCWVDYVWECGGFK